MFQTDALQFCQHNGPHVFVQCLKLSVNLHHRYDVHTVQSVSQSVRQKISRLIRCLPVAVTVL